MRTIVVALAAAVVVAGCATGAGSEEDVVQTLKSSFKARGIAKLDRLDQSELQRECSRYAQAPMPKPLAEKLEKAAMATVKYPADGKYIGDWKNGESIAQTGRGLQYNDSANTINGGNCYACHQLSEQEMSYGNIGPSLRNYGKVRGTSEPILKYTWAKIWNAHAFNACSQMPRFGDAGILTEAQLKDVMALLLDPASPNNQ
ncbi:MAG: sulfur oxidation c-type cytochrome SoxX [Burkholderiaceae bacterium]|nr:sulfur oxidation c-type cytochrome SoxX [Burkholderiaceae bacterium]